MLSNSILFAGFPRLSSQRMLEANVRIKLLPLVSNRERTLTGSRSAFAQTALKSVSCSNKNYCASRRAVSCRTSSPPRPSPVPPSTTGSRRSGLPLPRPAFLLLPWQFPSPLLSRRPRPSSGLGRAHTSSPARVPSPAKLDVKQTELFKQCDGSVLQASDRSSEPAIDGGLEYPRCGSLVRVHNHGEQRKRIACTACCAAPRSGKTRLHVV